MDVAEDEIMAQAAKTVGDLRYGPENNDYFWINDTQHMMVMHPFKPELNGKDISGVKDPNNKYLFKEIVEVAKAQGSGYVEYVWDKPGESKPVQKISYVKLYEPYGWIIGTGIYVDDIQKKIDAKEEELKDQMFSLIVKQLLVLAGVSLFILFVTILIARNCT